MAAMHEDDTPELREVGRILQENLQVNLLSFCIAMLFAQAITFLTLRMFSDARDSFESTAACCKSL